MNRTSNLDKTRPLNVLVACEYSGRVREAFASHGHNALSVDLLPTEVPGRHVQGDIFEFVASSLIEWDILIAHPPCTDLAVSGARYFPAKRADGRQASALEFVRRLIALPIKKKAIENPVSVISSQVRKPDQIIQPWMFGHGETKATCLWLYGLAPLLPTSIVDGRAAVVHRMRPGPDRWKNRSRTYLGIAAAMASQWGAV